MRERLQSSRLLPLSLLALALTAPGLAQGGERYVRARSGAAVRTFQDDAGKVLETLEEGALLRVYEESVGFYEVARPEGFPVWVYGQYLEPAGEAGVLRVTGDAVNMRPLPSSGVESYPLTQKLSRNDKVRLIARKDESLPLQQDWAQVWSPPGARAWVRADQTEALEAGASGAALWGKAVADTLAARKPVPTAQPASAPKEGAAGSSAGGAAAAGRGEVEAALDRADALFRAEKVKDEGGAIPDYEAVIQAYEAVQALGPQGQTALLVESRVLFLPGYRQPLALGFEILVGYGDIGVLLDVIAQLAPCLDLFREARQTLGIEGIVGVEILFARLVQASQ